MRTCFIPSSLTANRIKEKIVALSSSLEEFHPIDCTRILAKGGRQAFSLVLQFLQTTLQQQEDLSHTTSALLTCLNSAGLLEVQGMSPLFGFLAAMNDVCGLF